MPNGQPLHDDEDLPTIDEELVSIIFRLRNFAVPRRSDMTEIADRLEVIRGLLDSDLAGERERHRVEHPEQYDAEGCYVGPSEDPEAAARRELADIPEEIRHRTFEA